MSEYTGTENLEIMTEAVNYNRFLLSLIRSNARRGDRIADIGAGNREDLAVILADDYRDIDWRGQIRDKHTMLAASHKSTDKTQHITQLRVRVWGDTAVATGINQVHSASKGWTVEIPFTDVFARIDGHWRAVASQETVRTPPSPANRH